MPVRAAPSFSKLASARSAFFLFHSKFIIQNSKLPLAMPARAAPGFSEFASARSAFFLFHSKFIIHHSKFFRPAPPLRHFI